METNEKIGNVSMKPLALLKKICEENSIRRVINTLLPEYEKTVNNKIQTKEKIPMFTRDTRDKYIGENSLEELKKEEESLEI